MGVGSEAVFKRGREVHLDSVVVPSDPGDGVVHSWFSAVTRVTPVTPGPWNAAPVRRPRSTVFGSQPDCSPAPFRSHSAKVRISPTEASSGRMFLASVAALIRNWTA